MAKKNKNKNKNQNSSNDANAVNSNEVDVDQLAAQVDQKAQISEKNNASGDGKPTPVNAANDDLDALDAMWSDDDDKPKKGKNKKGGKGKQAEPAPPPAEDLDDDDDGVDDTPTVKTAAQKKKEKKERQKAAKKAAAQGGSNNVEESTSSKAAAPAEEENMGEIERLEKKDKLNKKEKMKLEMLKGVRARQQEAREIERKLQAEYEEEKRKIEEAKRKKEEEERIKAEQREIARKKKEEETALRRAKGLPTNKKEEAAFEKQKQMLAKRGIDIYQQLEEKYQAKLAMQARGETQQKRRVNMKNFGKKKQLAKQDSVDDTVSPPKSPEEETPPQEQEEKPQKEDTPSSDSGDSDDDWEKEEKVPAKKTVQAAAPVVAKKAPAAELVSEKLQAPDKALINNAASKSILAKVKDDPSWAELDPFDRVEARLKKRRKLAEKSKDLSVLRAPVVCVLGHVDTGKTKILDNLRRTNVQDGEAGGITQQIGATNVNINTVRDRTSFVKELKQIDIPGLLIIDTPGHESFANLRSRGQSLADIAILVVDIMHSLEQQTLESIELLKKGKTPFIIALNKIDRLYGWKSFPNKDIRETLELQDQNTKDEFEKRWDQVFLDFAQKSFLNVEKFWKNKDEGTDPKEHFMNVVPTSAHSGDGMGNLMGLVVQMCQTNLRKRVAFSEQVQCTVLEVKAVTGLGTTIDCILTQGRLRYGDHIVIAGSDGPIHTQIKALVMPQADKDLRVTNRAGGGTENVKEVSAANGVRILGRDLLDKALAGTTMHVAITGDQEEIEYFKEEVQEEIDNALKAIKTQKTGVYVMASTLGALEALVEYLRTQKIPFFGVNVGPVHKRDIMRAMTMLEIDPRWALILAFDVKVEREAQQYANDAGIKIFTADIIYHLFDRVEEHNKQYIAARRAEFKDRVKFPCRIQIMPEHVIRTRDPIIVGVKVVAGQLKPGVTLIAISKEHGQVIVGDVASVEKNNVAVDVAKDNDEVCIKIVGAQGEAPKLLGRHFEKEDILVSQIDRHGINLLKEWWREDMRTPDWKLVQQLKKVFQIL